MSEGAPGTAPALTERERRILEFERSWWSYDGSRDAAVREEFGLSPADYHRALGELIGRDEALEFDALLVKRLRRQRTARTRERSARRAPS